MYVRLAFSVAAHLQTDVLLVDEVLAVGDANFQRQCLGKLKEISQGGRTILFVSHNMAAVSGLCSRAIYLRDGQIRADGAPATVIGEYLSQTAAERLGATFDNQHTACSEKLELHAVHIAVDDDVRSVVTVRTPFHINVTFSKLTAAGRPNVSLYLYNMQGVCLFNTVSPLFDVGPGRYQAAVRVPGNLLNNGLHRLRVMLASDLVPAVDVDSALSFTVQDTERSIPVFGEWTGAVRPDLPWTLSERIP
jgi:lipopolysaccharide transport system ATP-binding protein